MWNKLKQLLCRHRFHALNTQCCYDPRTGTMTITETCIKCGKKFRFYASAENFGLEVDHENNG